MRREFYFYTILRLKKERTPFDSNGRPPTRTARANTTFAGVFFLGSYFLLCPGRSKTLTWGRDERIWGMTGQAANCILVVWIRLALERDFPAHSTRLTTLSLCPDFVPRKTTKGRSGRTRSNGSCKIIVPGPAQAMLLTSHSFLLFPFSFSI